MICVYEIPYSDMQLINLKMYCILNFQPIGNNSLLTGALDMGGGSAEISYLPESDGVPEKYESNITLYGVDYSIYSQSYLCFGFNEAHRRLFAHLIEDAAEVN